jgi:glycosyltransferase involved in cell wall biosynthesis
MAAGLPVVSTAIGAEGLDVDDGVNILIAEHPAEFAAACVRLLHEPGLRHSLAQNALQKIQQHHTWEIVGRELCEFLEQHLGRREVLSKPVPT